MDYGSSDNNSESIEEDSGYYKNPGTIKSSVLLKHISHVGHSSDQSNKSTTAINKHKRRSKPNSQVRTFKCSHCEKTYLSYPALYTHMKAKHSSPLEPLSTGSGRSRGRPKKVKFNL